MRTIRPFSAGITPTRRALRGIFTRNSSPTATATRRLPRRLPPGKKILIAPYGTNLLHADDTYVSQLDELQVDFIAYQDEVGVRKSTTLQTPEFYAALRRAHDRSGRSALWADVELFDFEGEVYRSALIPAQGERVRQQLQAVGAYCDEILCYQYLGLLNAPQTGAFCGHPTSAALYEALLHRSE